MYSPYRKELRRDVDKGLLPVFADQQQPKIQRVNDQVREVFYFKGERFPTLSLAKKKSRETSAHEAGIRHAFFGAFGVAKSKSGAKKNNSALDFISHHVPVSNLLPPGREDSSSWWSEVVETLSAQALAKSHLGQPEVRHALLGALAVDLVEHIVRERYVPVMAELFFVFDAEKFKKSVQQGDMFFADQRKGEKNVFVTMLEDRGVDVASTAPFMSNAQEPIVRAHEPITVFRVHGHDGSTVDFPRRNMAEEKVNAERNRQIDQISATSTRFGITPLALKECPKTLWLIENHTYNELSFALSVLWDHRINYEESIGIDEYSLEGTRMRRFVREYSQNLFAQKLYAQCQETIRRSADTDETGMPLPMEIVVHMVDFEGIFEEVSRHIEKTPGERAEVASSITNGDL